MSMIDGVNTIFTMEHKRGSMEIHAFKTRRAMVEAELECTPVEEKPEDIIKWLESLHAKVDEAILSIKKDYEIDGHRWSSEEQEACRG
jgi:hypothetical protein